MAHPFRLTLRMCQLSYLPRHSYEQERMVNAQRDRDCHSLAVTVAERRARRNAPRVGGCVYHVTYLTRVVRATFAALVPSVEGAGVE